jgi:hypothetical protein
MAMVGQINDTAELNGDGKTLLVTGWARFDQDERSAVMEVTVTQGEGGARANGVSGTTPMNKRAWTAEIRERHETQKFAPGPALAVVTATVKLKNGETEVYPEPGDEPWARYITLVG